MREPQRLQIEKDVACARRALHRAISVAESGAYYGVEDALHVVNADLAAVMDAVMRGKENVIFPARAPKQMYVSG